MNVQNAACALSRLSLKYFKDKTYIIDVCSDEVKKALGYYLASTTECEYDYSKVKCFTEDYKPCVKTESMTCEDQITFALSKVSTPCNFRADVVNPLDNSKYAELTLVNNLVYQNATLKTNFINNCKFSTTSTVNSGCSSVTCVPEFNPFFETSVTLQNVLTNANGFIKDIRLFRTENNGSSPLTAISVDISPANFASWNSCGTCVSFYTAADLLFGSVNFTAALTDILNNVAKTLLGGNFSEFTVKKSGNDVIISSKVKHNPNSYWVGINPDSCFISWVNNASAQTNIEFAPRSTLLRVENTAYARMYSSLSYYTPCGNYNFAVDFLPLWSVNTSATNINFASLLSSKSNTPFTITYPLLPCLATTLKATVTTNGVINTRAWRDSSNLLLSSTNEAIVYSPGTYTFTATTNNGCTQSTSAIV
jgi:hypothetical protein